MSLIHREPTFETHLIVTLNRHLLQSNIKLFDKLVIKQLLAQNITCLILTKLYQYLVKYKSLLPLQHREKFDDIKLPEEAIQLAEEKAKEDTRNYQVKIYFDKIGNEKLPRMNVHIKSVPSNTFTSIISLLKEHDFNYDPASKVWSKILNEYVLSNILSQPALKNIDVYVVNKDIEKDIMFIAQEAEKSIQISKAFDSKIEILGELKNLLKPFQKASIEYATLKSNILIADEMGLGKSVQSLSIAEFKAAYPLVIVCLANLKLNWENEVKKWFPNKRIQLIYSKDSFKKDMDIYVLNYDILKNQYKNILSIKPKAIILDESHAIKGQSQRTSFALQLKKIPIKICLTGTPVINKPIDLVNQLEFLECIKYFGGKTAFKKRYCDPQYDGYRMIYNGASNVVELQQKLRQFCMVRREKADVIKELPEKMIQEIYFELDNIKEYKKLEENIIEWYKEKIHISKIFDDEEKQRKLQQADYYTVEEFVKIEYLKQATAKFKLKKIYEWIDNTLAQTDKLIVFAHHRDIIEQLHTHYQDESVYLMGGMNDKVQDIITEFKDNPKKKLFIGSLMAAGTGLNLQFCNTMAFIELPWTWANVDQAMSRIHRIGQTEICNYYFLLAKNTIDEKIWELILSKKELMDSTTNYKKLQLLIESLQ